MPRIAMKTVGAIAAMPNGNAVIQGSLPGSLPGSPGDGPVEIEIPGEFLPNLIATLSSLVASHPAHAHRNFRPIFQLDRAEVKGSDIPGAICLILHCQPQLELAFAVPTAALAEMGAALSQAVETQSGSAKPPSARH